MSTIVLGKIDEYITELERIQDAPEASGYGSDLSCLDDLDEDMTDLAPDDPLAIAQAAYRRITTPRGTLEDDPDYGIDVVEDLSKASSEEERRSLAGRIRSEISKDERVASVVVTVTDLGAEKTIEIVGTPEGSDEQFRLVLALTDGELLVREMAAVA